jgi:methylthioribose-1-phosphate isomerase
MRKVLFPAYRAYASSRVLNRAKTALEPVRVKIEKARRTVVNITKALEMVKDERAVVMKEKIEQAEQEIVLLTRYIEKVELEAQTTGQVPDILL